LDEVDKIAGYAEQALTNDTFWYELGYWTGYAEGRADA
jgi:hypothetical protein